MSAEISVTVSERIYLSPDPQRDYEGSFYLTIAHGKLPSEVKTDLLPEDLNDADREFAAEKPSIILSGMRELAGADYLQEFVSNLNVSDDDWIIKKPVLSDNIVIIYQGEGLGEDFCVSAVRKPFVCRASRNGVFLLKVFVRGFPGVEDIAYQIQTRVAYTPWARSLTPGKNKVPVGTQVPVAYEYDGDNVDKVLYCNGVLMNTACSPYMAEIQRYSLFTLKVFNQNGIEDTADAIVEVDEPVIMSFTSERDYFAEGEEIRLRWEISSAVSWYLMDTEKSVDKTGSYTCTVRPEVSGDSHTVRYTLTANGYQGQDSCSVQAALELKRTNWERQGAVSGYFAGEVYGDMDYNSRIFCHEENWYCYAHPVMYKSSDGRGWKEYCRNTAAAPGFCCIAADYHNKTLYAMGREGEGSRLMLTRYDFETAGWDYEPARQSCSSSKGCFAFSQSEERYIQILPAGIMRVSRGEEGWNAGSASIPAPEGRRVLSGDYCFFKNCFYGAMLCDDHKIYVYRCEENMEEELFYKSVAEDDGFAVLLPAGNRLYAGTDSRLYDVVTQKTADNFYPLRKVSGGRPWFGKREGEIWGCFPDKNFWHLKEET